MLNQQSNFNEKTAKISGLKKETFLEIGIDDAARKMTDSKTVTIGVNQVVVEDTTNERISLSFSGKYKRIVEVEIRLSKPDKPVAKCNCPEGLKNFRCNHLMDALFAYLMLVHLKMAERITECSSCFVIPRMYQTS